MKKKTLEDMQKIATERGGKCLSKKYVNVITKLTWECSLGHKWDAAPNPVQQGSWCPICGAHNANIKKMDRTLARVKALSIEKGGTCISESYQTNKEKLIFECKEVHRWKAKPSKILHGNWCPECKRLKAGASQRLTLQDMKKVAVARGGKCLSKKYINSDTDLVWQCSLGHQWSGRPSHVKRGSWCPTCSKSIGERICRAYFEQIFNKDFPSIWPEWLINDDDNRMELDGYCQDLSIAFEHQGMQHYGNTPYFDRTKEEYKKRKKDDARKKEICEEHGVTLIEVPAIGSKLSIKQLKDFLSKEFMRKGIHIPHDYEDIVIDLEEVYTTPILIEKLNELKSIAQSHNGECLTTQYLGVEQKHMWQCEKGHQWEAIPPLIKKGAWCPYCAGNARLKIEDLQQLAESRGGECLSEQVPNALTKLQWRCKESHQWWQNANAIKRGYWCPYCAGVAKKTIEDMQVIAQRKGGECLSDIYVNGRTKLKWKCANGHEWDAKPENIIQGTWCPTCSRYRKKSLVGENKAQ